MKTRTTKKASRGSRGPRSTRPAAPVTPIPIATPAPAAPVAKPARARMSRRALSPAAKRGVELVRYLRIHTKKPYGTRGENAIVRLAREVGHLAGLELDTQAAR
jgi:hypothetical protein